MSAMQRNDLCILSALLLAGLATPAFAVSKSDHVVKNPPAKMEHVEGSDLPRVVLTEKATKRLDIQTAPVGEEKVRRWLIVNGEVEVTQTQPKAQDGYAVAVTASEQPDPVQISVPMVAGWMAGSHSVRVLYSDDVDDTDDDQGQKDDEDDNDMYVIFVLPGSSAVVDNSIRIRQSETTAAANAGEAINISYQVDGNLNGLKAGDRVPVKFSRPKSGGLQKVVPYSAVIYGAHGDTWLYVNPEPLVFVRHAIIVDYIDDEQAVLKEGPAVGTLVVTVGAAELFGFEHKIGH